MTYPYTTVIHRPQVALFVTCLTDQFYPHVGLAVVRVLEHFGCEVVFPEAQTCCGQPFFNNGFSSSAADLCKRMVEIFEPYEAVVTPSGSCCAMVREHLPHLLENDPAYATGASALAAKTYEFVEFLTKKLQIDFSQFKLPKQTELTYHYTCHLRGIGVRDEGVNALKAIGNVAFTPLEKSDQCCGFGGTFAIKYPDISKAMVQDKLDCLKKTNAPAVICNDAGCSMNIAGMCNRAGHQMQVTHIAEILAQALGIDLSAAY